MCIGICSVKCENGCSSCANQCGWWCDSSCNRECFSNCSTFCINSCVGSCSTYLTSDTKLTKGPDRPPTADGYTYPNPKNRWEERESFKIVQDIPPYRKTDKEIDDKIVISTIPNKFYAIVTGFFSKVSERIQRVKVADEDKHVIRTNMMDITTNDLTSIWKYANNSYFPVHLRHLYPGDFIYLWDVDAFGQFTGSRMLYPDDANIVVTAADNIVYNIIQISRSTSFIDDMVSLIGSIDEAVRNFIVGFVTYNESNGLDDNYYIVKLHDKNGLKITVDEIKFILPFGFDSISSVNSSNGDLYVIIHRDRELYPIFN